MSLVVYTNYNNSGMQTGPLPTSTPHEVGMSGQQYKNFMKQQSYPDPKTGVYSHGAMGSTPTTSSLHHMHGNTMVSSSERVLSPSNLTLSPGSIPLDLSKKPMATGIII